MDEEEEAAGGGGEEGGAGWIMTFADLMSLLMCFFVLLLSFSEMDVLKFKQLAGSMKEAFGIQREVKVKDIPKGTSIVAQEFSPGRPTPTAIAELRQQTTDESKQNLDFSDQDQKDMDDLQEALKEELERILQEKLEMLESLLAQEVQQEVLELSSEENEIVIRIREKGSFPSGSAKLDRDFHPILNKIGRVLKDIDGAIVVSGHTDTVPIATEKYPSNWVLSADRAASVVHHLTKYAGVPDKRMEIRANGETKPIDDNATWSGRAKNRRVEISVRFGNFETIEADDLRATYEASQYGVSPPQTSANPSAADRNDNAPSGNSSP